MKIGNLLNTADPEPVADCGLTEGEVKGYAMELAPFLAGQFTYGEVTGFVRRIAALGYARGWEARGERDQKMPGLLAEVERLRAREKELKFQADHAGFDGMGNAY